LDRNNEGVAYAFLNKVLNRFGVLVEIFIAWSMEFLEEFKKLCDKALIENHITSWDHAKVDGLAKWMV
jgi:hypothetical protein